MMAPVTGNCAYGDISTKTFKEDCSQWHKVANLKMFYGRRILVIIRLCDRKN